MSMKEKMHRGDLYMPDDPEIVSEQVRCLDRLYEYNSTRPTEADKREKLLSEMFAQIGEGCYIEPPLHANFGGRHCHWGKHIYANFNLTMVDDTGIYVGDNTMFGPNVVLATAGHPILPELREKGCQYNVLIHIGKNCWLGAGVIVLPGVTIGDNTVVGAGSVICPQTWWRSEIRAGSCVRSESTTGNIISKTEKLTYKKQADIRTTCGYLPVWHRGEIT